MVAVGQTAPDFLAPVFRDGEGEAFELFAELRDCEAVVLLFAPADFVPACTAELVAVDEAGWQHHPDLAVAGLTGDSLFSHAAYAEQYGLSIPLISDFHAGVAQQYDLVLDRWEGHSTTPARATVVIDAEWTVRAREEAAPLAESRPTPAERATESLAALGLDVETPEVQEVDSP